MIEYKNYNFLKNKHLKIPILLSTILFVSIVYSTTEKTIRKIESAIPIDFIENRNKLAIEKDVTIIFYFAGVNNLGYFLRKNLSQLAEIGSNKNINIVVQLDVLLPGNKKATKRYYVEKNKLIILNQNDPGSQNMDSGDPKSLISWCAYCMQHYKAKRYILVLSNHATGIIDIGQARAVNPSQLFTFNPTTNMIELNRAVPFLEFIATPENQRGICFDDITGHYLTNSKLDYALKTICSNHIHGKFEMIIFDACLQQMYEIALLVKPYTKIMMGSEEVILAPGLDYQDVLKPFENQKINTLVFAKHIVSSYENTYKKITNDYTFSAIDITNINVLEKNVNNIATLLIDCIKNQKNSLIKEAIKTSRHKLLCTYFDEPSYIDLHHFYTNLATNFDRLKLKPEIDTTLKTKISQLIATLKDGLQIIKKIIIANVAGKNLSKAQGISIYFPEFGPKHPSYKYSHPWSVFLDYYLHL
jgi:archaellum component FlaF (FlaF/FlaG flagellin family)